MKSFSIESSFELLAGIYKPSELIVIGANVDAWLKASQELSVDTVSYIDADKKQLAKLNTLHTLPDNWSVYHATVYKESTKLPFYMLSNPGLNGTVSDEFLSLVWKNLTTAKTVEQDAVSLDELLKDSLSNNLDKWLVIDCFGGLDILKGAKALLENIEVVVVKSIIDDNIKLSEISEQKLDIWMGKNGYTKTSDFEENNPKVITAIYTKEYKKKIKTLTTELNTTKQENQKAIEQAKQTKVKELETINKTLAEEKKKSETLKTQKDVLNKTIEERTKEKETLGTTLQTKQKENETLLTELNTTKQENQKAIEQAKQTKVKELETINKTLADEKKKSETLKTQKDVLNKTIEERTKEKETLGTTLQTKQKENETLTSQLNITKQENQKAIENISKLEEEYQTTKYILNHINKITTFEEMLLIAKAENALNREEYKDAISYWQQVASLMGSSMPQLYYERLSKAYKNIGGFPVSNDEEERLNGTNDKYEILKKLHEILSPGFYLEIGVQTGKSLVLSKCQSIGIDPMPMINQELKINHKVISQTSDIFFKLFAKSTLLGPIDFAFIDGMHLFEYALRDFINVEKYSTKNTIIVIDDIYPGHTAQANRDRKTRAWTGDIWKLCSILKEYRKDLQIVTLDVFPTGLMIIRNLDNKNNVLEENMKKIREIYINKKINKNKYIERKDSQDANIFLDTLKKDIQMAIS